MEDKSIKIIWEDYLKSIGESIEKTDKTYEAWHFCNDEESANKLADLTVKGIKRGTTSLYKFYELENEEIPKIGAHSIITNWDKVAKCIIRDKNIYVLPFKDVDEVLARIEGEGDKSLSYWREVHIDCFTKELKEIGMDFDEDMLVVFEEFEVVYK